MTRELLAMPTIGRPPVPAHDVDLSALAADLQAADIDAEIRFDAGSRATYSTDASNYRMVPLGVVVPRSVEAVPEIIEVCRRHGAPIVSRGGGTSLAGQCTNTAVVLDWSKYCHHVLEVDTEARTCLVEPGIVLDSLNEHLRQTGLEFGPRPATHDHCTLGGMIGNNSCGATAQRTGKVVDNVVELEVLPSAAIDRDETARSWYVDGALCGQLNCGFDECRVHEGLRHVASQLPLPHVVLFSEQPWCATCGTVAFKPAGRRRRRRAGRSARRGSRRQ